MKPALAFWLPLGGYVAAAFATGLLIDRMPDRFFPMSDPGAFILFVWARAPMALFALACVLWRFGWFQRWHALASEYDHANEPTPEEIDRRKHPERYYEDFSFFWFAPMLALILVVLTAPAFFNPSLILFSNDGPLGGLMARSSSAMTGGPTPRFWFCFPLILWPTAILGPLVYLGGGFAFLCGWAYVGRWRLKDGLKNLCKVN